MTIVCATDRLPKSEPAIERAGILADQLNTDITLLHVVSSRTAVPALEETLLTAQAQMKARARPPVWRSPRMPSIAVRAGNPARLILETMTLSRARLLVLGPHRERPRRDTLEGTIAEKALAARKCPVLIVQNEARSPYARALLALDLSAASASALRAAELLVLAPQVDAQIVYAQRERNEARFSQCEALQAIRETFDCESADFARYQIRIEPHQPTVAILRTVETFQPDILVMGTRGGGRLHRALLGSVANRVLHDLACDTLIVPEGSVGKVANVTIAGSSPNVATGLTSPSFY